jgi:hypothetical protein
MNDLEVWTSHVILNLLKLPSAAALNGLMLNGRRIIPLG